VLAARLVPAGVRMRGGGKRSRAAVGTRSRETVCADGGARRASRWAASFATSTAPACRGLAAEPSMDARESRCNRSMSSGNAALARVPERTRGVNRAIAPPSGVGRREQRSDERGSRALGGPQCTRCSSERSDLDRFYELVASPIARIAGVAVVARGVPRVQGAARRADHFLCE
jgi:hypothetical protein